MTAWLCDIVSGSFIKLNNNIKKDFNDRREQITEGLQNGRKNVAAEQKGDKQRMRRKEKRLEKRKRAGERKREGESQRENKEENDLNTACHPL